VDLFLKHVPWLAAEAAMNHRQLAAAVCLRFLLLMVALVAALSRPALAAFTVSGEVSPSDPSTWSSDSPATCYIGKTLAGTLTVDGGSDLASFNAYIGYESTATGIVNIAGTGSTWTTGYDFSPNIFVGYAGSGTLSVTDGGLIGTNGMLYAGSNAGSTGVINVVGTGSRVVGQTLVVGSYGSGILSISGGGSVPTWCYVGVYSGSTGLVTVNGPGSSLAGLQCVGGVGSGTLSISSGGSVSATANPCPIGESSGSKGVVTVDGPGSLLIGALYVGNSGRGTLSITNGGNASAAAIGVLAGSEGIVSVDGPGSILQSGKLEVGRYGSGALSITNGGTLQCRRSEVDIAPGYLGQYAGSKGTLLVDGPGSSCTFDSGLFYVGCSGGGTLSINNGGSVKVGTLVPGPSGDMIVRAGFVYVAGQEHNGLISVNGHDSALTIIGSLCIGAGGSSGSLLITNGGSVSNLLDSAISGSASVVTVDGAGSTWNNTAFLDIGGSANATLTITNRGSVSAGDIGVASSSGSSGVVTVDGVGSTLSANRSLAVGKSGPATLNVTNGGEVKIGGTTYLNAPSGGGGTISFGTNGGTLTTRSLCFSDAAQLAGTGTINTRGLVGNVNLVFDSTDDLKQTFLYQQTGKNVAVNVDLSAPAENGDFGTGFSGAGSLTITNGMAITSANGYVGCNSGSKGVATVSGLGSRWTNIGTLNVAYNSGAGTLSVVGGGSVEAANVALGTGGVSLLAIDVARGSALRVGGGSGTITNSGGRIRLLAGAGVPLDDSIKYSPISASTWGAAGYYQAVGGKWDATNHLFTPSSVASGTSGSAIPLNLAAVERALVTYGGIDGANWTVGASFVAAASTQNVTFTATGISGSVLAGLEGTAGEDQDVLSGWTLATSNYTVSMSNPIYFSFKVGAGRSADDLKLWQYSGTKWTSYTPFDLTYDGTYASFTATALRGYAVTGTPVPEPGTVGLLGVAVLAVLGWGWRRRR
jgi:fibronectin-binding autotransporter adhesin